MVDLQIYAHQSLNNKSSLIGQISFPKGTFKFHKEPSTKRNELIERWGIGWMTLFPHERQISMDNWVSGQVGIKGVLTYKIRILDTNQIFAIRIIYTRVP